MPGSALTHHTAMPTIAHHRCCAATAWTLLIALVILRHRASPGPLRPDCLSVPRCRAGASPPAHVDCGWRPERAPPPLGPQDPAAEGVGEEAGEDSAPRLFRSE